MVQFIGDGEKDFINSATDQSMIMLGLYVFWADRDVVYDNIVHRYLPVCRW